MKESKNLLITSLRPLRKPLRPLRETDAPFISRRERRGKNAETAKKIHQCLLSWYKKNGRKFLWREKNISPYVVLVSEIMLQQTQASRVAEKLPLFLKKFPNIFSLAKAPQNSVLRAWQGMGYNNRAIRLHQCAKKIVDEHNGKIPQDAHDLIKLSGIGRYTSHAISLFAFYRRVAVVDVNIARVLTRLVQKVKTTEEIFLGNKSWELAEKFLPKEKKSAHDWSQALMDVGAMFCTKRFPKCGECPLQKFCASTRKIWPAEKNKKKKPEPMIGNFPRRIVRGKIIELLRKKSFGKKNILSALQKNGITISKKESTEVFFHLQKDGIISFHQKNFFLKK